MMTQNPAAQPDTTGPSPLRPFFIIWSGQIVSALGSGLVQFALIWYLTTTTGSATVLAFASMIGLLPQILLLPIAGVLVDRWDRRLVMIAADGLIAAATVFLALGFLFAWTPLWLIYSILLIRSVGSAFHWPAMQASIPLLVPEKELTRVSGINQGMYGLLSIVIPPVAALLLAWLPIQSILAIDVGTAIIAIVPLLLIHIPQPTRADRVGQDQDTAKGNKPSMLDDFRAGFAFVWQWRGLRLIVGLSLVTNIFFAPANALVPVLVTKTFGGDALALAWVQASAGLGVVFGGLLLGAWGGFQNRMLTALLGLFCQSLGFLIVGFLPKSAFPWLLLAIGLIGMMTMILNSAFFAALQAVVPNAIQGRVLTLITSSLNATMPLGLLMAGPLADRMGVQILYTLCGIVTLIVSIICLTPSILYLEAQGKQMVAAQSATGNQDNITTSPFSVRV